MKEVEVSDDVLEEIEDYIDEMEDTSDMLPNETLDEFKDNESFD